MSFLRACPRRTLGNAQQQAQRRGHHAHVSPQQHSPQTRLAVDPIKRWRKRDCGLADVHRGSTALVCHRRTLFTTSRVNYASSMSSKAGSTGISDFEESEVLRMLEEDRKRTVIHEEELDIGSYISPDDLAAFRAAALSQWPGPRSKRGLPPGWSSQWDQWPYLLTLYWHSPYFLMLPQIEMAVNLTFGIKAETRPLTFWSGNPNQEEDEFGAGPVGGVFVFTLAGESHTGSPRFFLLDSMRQELYGFSATESESDVGISSEDNLVEYLHKYSTLETLYESPHLKPVNPSGTGMKLLGRILERDEGVIEDLERDGWVNERLPLSLGSHGFQNEDGVRKLRKTEVWEERPDVLKRLLTPKYSVEGASESNGGGGSMSGLWELGEMKRRLEREEDLELLRRLTEKVKEEVEDMKRKYGKDLNPRGGSE